MTNKYLTNCLIKNKLEAGGQHQAYQALVILYRASVEDTLSEINTFIDYLIIASSFPFSARCARYDFILIKFVTCGSIADASFSSTNKSGHLNIVERDVRYQ